MFRQLVPIAKANEHGVPGTSQSLHWVAFHREYNGAEKAEAIVKFGGRLYIDPLRFLEWMATGPRISPPVARNRQKIKQIKTGKAGAGSTRIQAKKTIRESRRARSTDANVSVALPS